MRVARTSPMVFDHRMTFILYTPEKFNPNKMSLPVTAEARLANNKIMSRREQQFLSLPRTLRSIKSDLTMISFGRYDPYHCQAEPNEKRKEFQLPLIDHIKSLRKHYVTGQRYEEIEGYRKKIY